MTIGDWADKESTKYIEDLRDELCYTDDEEGIESIRCEAEQTNWLRKLLYGLDPVEL